MATICDDDHIVPTKTCVVLGGRGFLGRSLVNKLLQLGNWIVRVADSAHSIELRHDSEDDSLLSAALSDGRAFYHCADVRDMSQVITALKGSSVVFYMDGSDLDNGNLDHCYMIIVEGTKNVINACRECKVRKLIYGSSSDVVFDGSCDIHNQDETMTWSCKHDDLVIDLKAQAEALVLFANDVDCLLTCALRPGIVFGPGDPQLVPFLINLANSRLSKFYIGSGKNLSDFTYTENVTNAHICAEQALGSRMPTAAGKAFFITNFEPVKFWDFVSHLYEGLGYQRPYIKIPARIFWYIFMLTRWMQGITGFRNCDYTMSARYFLHLASCSRTFNCTAAKKFLNYSPVVSLEEGIKRTIESFSYLPEDLLCSTYDGFGGQSKVDSLLGGGEVADILLWKDETTSFTYFVLSSFLYYWFFLAGRNFTSSAANLLLLFTIILYGYGILPSEILGLRIPKLSLHHFQVSSLAVKDLVGALSYFWNKFVCNIRSLSEAGDWHIFFKAILLVYILKQLSNSLSAVIAGALVFAFTAFFVYEQYELVIDGIAKALVSSLNESLRLLTKYLPASVSSFLSHRKTLPEK